MIRVDFHTDAALELNAAASFYDSVMKSLGKAFVTEVRNAVELLKNFPDAGPKIDGKLRKLTVRRFPYSLIYRHDAQTVLILAVAHHRRRPRYWKSRS